MADIEPGHVWEVYSNGGGNWVRAVIASVDGDEVTLRYEGVLEFLRVDRSSFENKPEQFRQVPVLP